MTVKSFYLNNSPEATGYKDTIDNFGEITNKELFGWLTSKHHINNSYALAVHLAAYSLMNDTNYANYIHLFSPVQPC